MARKGYEFVEHTADVEFIARGKNLESLFKNALLAQFETIADIKKLAASEEKDKNFSIHEKAKNLEDLLWFVLQDALSLSDSKGLYGYDISSIKLSKKNIYDIVSPTEHI